MPKIRETPLYFIQILILSLGYDEEKQPLKKLIFKSKITNLNGFHVAEITIL